MSDYEKAIDEKAQMSIELFGPNIVLLRLVNALLAAFGIWGISKLLLQETNEKLTTVVALSLAIHPTFLTSTVVSGF